MLFNIHKTELAVAVEETTRPSLIAGVSTPPAKKLANAVIIIPERESEA